MSSDLLLQQCPVCLAHLIWMVFEMSSRWLYSCCFVGCCFQDFFNIAHRILVQLPFFSLYAYSMSKRCIHTVVWTRLQLGKKRFILSDWSDFHMTYLNCCPVGRGCRIHTLHLCRGVKTPHQMSVLI